MTLWESMLLIRIVVLEKQIAELKANPPTVRVIYEHRLDNIGAELLKLLDKNTYGPRPVPERSDDHAIPRSDPAST